MILKEINEGGVICWNQQKKNSHLFATGSQNTIDKGILSIYQFDHIDKSMEPTLIGTTTTNVPFTSMTWSTYGENSSFQTGLIFGGMQDGSLMIFNSDEILQRKNDTFDEKSNGCVYIGEDGWNCPVYSVEYNPFKPYLIALGGQEVLFYDISKDVYQPAAFVPAQENCHEGYRITSVSWNKKVPHILASASENGLTVVWDFKTSKPIFQFYEQSRKLNKSVKLDWNPEIPTQIAVAYDNEKSPDLQIWDLRNAKGPVVQLTQGHTAGINCVSWCSNDPSLILTAGRDQKLICWNYQTEEIVTEVQYSEDLSKAVWSKIPSLFGVTTQSDGVKIQSLNSEEIQSYAPKWYQPPVGAAFSVRDEIAIFSEETTNVVSIMASPFDQFKPTKQKQEFIKRMKTYFECDNDEEYIDHILAQKTEKPEKEELWQIMKAMLNEKLIDIIQALGFEQKAIIKKAESYTGKKHIKSKGDEDLKVGKPAKPNRQTFANLDDPVEFFNTLGQVQNCSENLSSSTHQAKGSNKGTEDEIASMEQISKNVNWNAGVEKIIKENILVGNYEGAIDCALKCGRNAEALLIAYSKSPELFQQTMKSFFTACTDNFIKNIFQPLVEKDLKFILENYDLNNWRECAALLCTASSTLNVFEALMIQLSNKFNPEYQEHEQGHLATLILSKNCNQFLSTICSKLNQFIPLSDSRLEYLLSVGELVVVFKTSLGGSVNSPEYDQIVHELATFLIEYQEPALAYWLLELANEETLQISLLKEILYYSYKEINSRGQNPPHSYKPEPVGVSKNFHAQNIPAKKKEKEQQFGQKTATEILPENQASKRSAMKIFQPNQIQTVGTSPVPPINNATQDVTKAKHIFNPLNVPPPVMPAPVINNIGKGNQMDQLKYVPPPPALPEKKKTAPGPPPPPPPPPVLNNNKNTKPIGPPPVNTPPIHLPPNTQNNNLPQGVPPPPITGGFNPNQGKRVPPPPMTRKQ